MPQTLMLLPSRHFDNARLVRVPDDFEVHEAYRHATGVIAQLEEQSPDCSPEDVLEALEEHGFEPVPFMLGPELC